MAIELNFTKNNLAKIALSKSRKVYRDTGSKQSEPTLHLYVGKQTKTLYFVKKANGRKTEYRLGTFPALPIEAARKRAKSLSVDVDSGIDPQEVKRARRNRGITLGEAFDSYLIEASNRAVRPLKQSTVTTYTRSKKIYFKAWLNKPASEITTENVKQWFAKSAKKSPTGANSAIRHARAVFNHHNLANPFSGLKLVKEIPRTACIESTDLPSWFEAVSKLSNETTRDYLHALIFTGARRREIASLKWSDVDLRRRIVTLTDTKSGAPLEIPISSHLITILTKRKLSLSKDSEFVFPSYGKAGYISEPKKSIARIEALSGVYASPHALRRTYSNIAQFHAEIPFIAVKKLLNHATDSRDITASHYSVISTEELRNYQQRVCNTILKLGKLNARKQRKLEAVK